MSFEIATKLKLRFPSVNGLITIEDLWGLPLTSKRADRANLLDVGRTIAKEIKTSDEDDFGIGDAEVSADDELNILRLEIVKAIIKSKKLDNKARKDADDAKEQRKVLLARLKEIEDEEIGKKTKEEVLAELNALG